MNKNISEFLCFPGDPKNIATIVALFTYDPRELILDLFFFQKLCVPGQNAQ